MVKNRDVVASSCEEIRIGRYRESRFWGVWLGEELITVTVYKRGAEAVAKLAREFIRRYPSEIARYVNEIKPETKTI